MKVTALIPDEFVVEVKQFTQGETITDSLIKALSEWGSYQRIKSLNSQIYQEPLVFKENFNPYSVRKINREDV